MTVPSAIEQDCRRVYWHRELPPVDAEIIGEHVLEATSDRVQDSLAHRGELWDRCYRGLLDNAHERFTQEIRRLGGDYAHVLDESIDSRHDPVTGEAWLHGRFTYVLYRRCVSGHERRPLDKTDQQLQTAREGAS